MVPSRAGAGGDGGGEDPGRWRYLPRAPVGGEMEWCGVMTGAREWGQIRLAAVECRSRAPLSCVAKGSVGSVGGVEVEQDRRLLEMLPTRET